MRPPIEHSVPTEQFEAIQSGFLRTQILPYSDMIEEGQKVVLSEVDRETGPTDRVLGAEITYVTSIDNQCRFFTEALNPTVCIASIALLKTVEITHVDDLSSAQL